MGCGKDQINTYVVYYIDCLEQCLTPNYCISVCSINKIEIKPASGQQNSKAFMWPLKQEIEQLDSNLWMAVIAPN